MKNSIKDLFQKIIMEEISILEFENWLYENHSIEDKIGSDIYIELISLNFKRRDSKAELTKLLTGKIITEEELKAWKLRNIFSNYGWFEGRKVQLEPDQNKSSNLYSYAIKILEEFGVCMLAKGKYLLIIRQMKYASLTSHNYHTIAKLEKYTTLLKRVEVTL